MPEDEESRWPAPSEVRQTAAVYRVEEEVEYPESDGEPMAESDVHREEMTYLIEALADYFRDEADVYVSGNLFLYYRPGDPSAQVAPDVMVVRGVAKGRRRVYKLWQEGRAPSVVIEVTSRKTRAQDQGAKLELYARLGVEECFLYDPMGEYLRPPLQGYRLVGARYRRLEPAADGSLPSEELGLTLRLEEGRMGLYETRGGRPLLRDGEARERERAAQARADREAAKRRAAEARTRELERELERLRAGRGE